MKIAVLRALKRVESTAKIRNVRNIGGEERRLENEEFNNVYEVKGEQAQV